jgi:hypothetical protein
MFRNSKQIALKISNRKALVADTFSSVISPLVTFVEIYFLRDTPQVILVLMTPVLSFHHVGSREKGRSHRQNKDIII